MITKNEALMLINGLMQEALDSVDDFHHGKLAGLNAAYQLVEEIGEL